MAMNKSIKVIEEFFPIDSLYAINKGTDIYAVIKNDGKYFGERVFCIADYYRSDETVFKSGIICYEDSLLGFNQIDPLYECKELICYTDSPGDYPEYVLNRLKGDHRTNIISMKDGKVIGTLEDINGEPKNFPRRFSAIEDEHGVTLIQSVPVNFKFYARYGDSPSELKYKEVNALGLYSVEGSQDMIDGVINEAGKKIICLSVKGFKGYTLNPFENLTPEFWEGLKRELRCYD